MQSNKKINIKKKKKEMWLFCKELIKDLIHHHQQMCNTHVYTLEGTHLLLFSIWATFTIMAFKQVYRRITLGILFEMYTLRLWRSLWICILVRGYKGAWLRGWLVKPDRQRLKPGFATYELGQLFNLSVPWFPHPSDEVRNSTYLLGLL